VNTRDDKFLRFIQKCKHLFPTHGRETLQESFNGFTRFNIFDEGLNGYKRPCETGVPPSISGETATIRLVMAFILC
jgi:hypothetical protein